MRDALAAEVGTSLLRVDGDAVAPAVGPIPVVRALPVRPRVPAHAAHRRPAASCRVLVLRQVPGRDAFLVAASGRVIRTLAHPRLSRLPRLWVTKEVDVAVGERASGAARRGRDGARAAPGCRRCRAACASVRVGKNELTLVLGGGLELRLGDTGDLRLKLAIARRILRADRRRGSAAGYLDVSVPERPVLSLNSQVGG